LFRFIHWMARIAPGGGEPLKQPRKTPGRPVTGILKVARSTLCRALSAA
jgi:hypothetical protein